MVTGQCDGCRKGSRSGGTVLRVFGVGKLRDNGKQRLQLCGIAGESVQQCGTVGKHRVVAEAVFAGSLADLAGLTPFSSISSAWTRFVTLVANAYRWPMRLPCAVASRFAWTAACGSC
jgi:hypothetical protein